MNIPYIANLISELLHTSDCVTIPDFGAFVSNEVSAKLDPVKHKITPPGPQISFNKNIKNNDGLLANFLATKEGISYEEAVAEIKQLATHIQTELKKTKSFDFGVLGSFYIASGNILKFEPGAANPNFDLGLHPMTLTPLANEPWAEKSAVGKSAIVQPVSLSAEDPKDQQGLPWRKIAMGLILLPVGAYLAWMPPQTNMFSKTANFNASELNPFGKAPVQNYEERQSDRALTQEEANEINAQLDEDIPVLVSAEDTPSENLVMEETQPSTETPEETSFDSEIRFHLIGGCFGEETNALNLVETLKLNGIDAQILDVNKGLHRVTLGGYTTKQEAKQALNRLKTEYNTSAWVLTL